MNGKIFRIIFTASFSLILVAVFLSGTLGAMSWPAEDAVLFRNFGFNNGGKPVLGMVFSGEGEVLAAEKGEIIFSREMDNDVSRLPSPFGAWTAVDHEDGLISIYCRYAEDKSYNGVDFGNRPVNKNEPIASSGISGWSSRNGFYFIIFDRRERRWINPAMIITPLQEVGAPQILSFELRNAQGLPVQSQNITQGRYTIFVNAVSAGALRPGTTQRNLLAPQRIVCLINGAEAGSLAFENVSARDGVLMVYRNGLVPADQIYANFPSFETAEVFLTRGQVTLEIIVQDIAGNSRSLISRLIVN